LLARIKEPSHRGMWDIFGDTAKPLRNILVEICGVLFGIVTGDNKENSKRQPKPQ